MSNEVIHATAEDTLASKGKSFHWARRLLGEKDSQRATRLYQFCRYIDDVVDEAESVDLSRKNLVEVRQAVVSGLGTNAVLVDGLNLIKECDIDCSAVLDLVQGVGSDIELVRIMDQDELLRYCYQVAGTVGLMMCKVLNSHDNNAIPYAIDLGIAMQLTNICRDIKDDALINRRYLPIHFINDMDIQDLITPTGSKVKLIKKAVASLLASADKYYESGECGLSYLPFRARLSILVAARVYREIGKELEKQDYEYWHRRIIVRTPRKLLVTLTAVLSAVTSLRFWRHPAAHDSSLHKAIQGYYVSEPRSAQIHEN